MDVHPSKEALAAHALGALPDDGERALVAAHVGECASCAAQLGEFRQAAAALVPDDTNGSKGEVDFDLAALERAWAQVKRRLAR
jgi:anti-sigma factor ChrR (cupin superfamily)